MGKDKLELRLDGTVSLVETSELDGETVLRALEQMLVNSLEAAVLAEDLAEHKVEDDFEDGCVDNCPLCAEEADSEQDMYSCSKCIEKDQVNACLVEVNDEWAKDYEKLEAKSYDSDIYLRKVIKALREELEAKPKVIGSSGHWEECKRLRAENEQLRAVLVRTADHANSLQQYETEELIRIALEVNEDGE